MYEKVEGRMKLVILVFIIGTFVQSFKCATFNYQELKSSLNFVLDIADEHDIVYLNEHWLQLNELTTIEDIYEKDASPKTCYLKFSVDPTGELRGRLHGGVAFLCKKLKPVVCKPINCENDSLFGLQIIVNQSVLLYVLVRISPI